MECPSCKAPAPDGAAECPVCGLIFAKWSARHAPPPEAEAPPPAEEGQPEVSRPQTEDPPGAFDRLGVSLTVLLLLAALGFIGYVLFKPTPKPPPPAFPVPQTAFVKTVSADYEKPPEAASSPVPKATWRFEGRVVDVLHLVPIQGATLRFDLNPPVEAVTDASGHYEASVEVPEGCGGIYVWPSHSDFGNQYQAGDLSDQPYETRVRMYGQVPFQGSHAGSPEHPTRLDFSMFPAHVTEEEERKIRDTLYPPARD